MQREAYSPSGRSLPLITERLTLTSWQPSDWTALRPIATDPAVMRYIRDGTLWTDEEIQAFVNRQIELYAERGFCRWKLIERATGDMIGFCGVGIWHGDEEIGWWLAHRYWGMGIATEAARVALDDAFRRVSLPRIISVAQAANVASTRIMQKLGLTRDAELVVDGRQLVRYAIAHEQYLATAVSIRSLNP